MPRAEQQGPVGFSVVRRRCPAGSAGWPRPSAGRSYNWRGRHDGRPVAGPRPAPPRRWRRDRRSIRFPRCARRWWRWRSRRSCDPDRAADRPGEHVGPRDHPAAAASRPTDWAATNVGLAISPRPSPKTKQVAATYTRLEPGPTEQQTGAGQHEDGADDRRGAEAEAEVEPTRVRGGDRPAEGQGGEREPGHQRGGAEHVLHVEGDVGRQSDHITPMTRLATLVPRPPGGAVPSRAGSAPRPGARRTRRRPAQHPETEHGDARSDSHGQSTPPSSRPRITNEAPTATGPSRRRRAGACWARSSRGTASQHERGGGADRDVDEEDPAPVDVVGEDAAERGPDHRGDAPDAGDVALHLGPLGQGVEVADDRHRHRLDGARTEALQRPEDDQRRHAPGEAAEHRAEHESPTPTSMIGLRPTVSLSLP